MPGRGGAWYRALWNTGEMRVGRVEARDIMTTDVITFTPDMSIGEVVDELLRHRIHGAPVVDRTGQIVGMISLMDLAARPGKQVRDVMSPEPVSASEDAPVEELAGMMLDQMVRRIPITRGGRVVGLVSASDIIRVFLHLHEARRPTPAGQP
jgi:CBS domain-containing protein